MRPHWLSLERSRTQAWHLCLSLRSQTGLLHESQRRLSPLRPRTARTHKGRLGAPTRKGWKKMLRLGHKAGQTVIEEMMIKEGRTGSLRS